MSYTHRRPVTADHYVWGRNEPTPQPGIAIKRGGYIVAHLGYDDARSLADSIHDLVDEHETEEQEAAH
ncbi:hypothetical protein SCMU_27740 [Sinomonas cyclohexanicum]|uniref:Uncharacterized protein n=1 Tax=Sinomonas cyclohexanicum TaxID=322009 RepID=A0ABN6FLG4_SINCY|nr:hypothetical protein [Corynebacterium cyclohexanicum]BCT76932.1 hypothetical protein SCMU_27740 [Corynebacterium cyclohexanicum]